MEPTRSVSIKIEELEYLYDPIKFYAATLCNKNKDNSIKLDYSSKFKMKDKSNKIFKKIGCGITIIKFDDIDIVIEIKEIGNPVGLEASSTIHSVMWLYVEKNSKTPEENHKILEEFINKSSVFYIQNIMDKKKEENKISLYIWDDYWETIEKRTSRYLNTLYLDGKDQEIKKMLKDFLSDETREEYKRFGMPYKLNILLHGIPGTGKSSLIFSLASELEMDIALLYFTKDMTDIDFMRALRRIPENTFLVIEDVDTIFESRKKNDEFKNNISFSGIINSLDGIGYIDRQIIILTTNCKMVLDKALTRPGRIDLDVEFTYSTKSQIEAMFNAFLTCQEERFESFYKKIKHHKITTAMLQQFFFANRKCKNIIEHIDELIKTINDNDYNTKKESMYC